MIIGRVLVSFIAIFLWTVEAGASVFAQSVESFSALPPGIASEEDVLFAPDTLIADFASTAAGPGFVTVAFGSWKAIDGPGNDVIVHLFGDWDPPESFFVDAGDGATFERLGYSGIPDYSKGAIGFGFDLADVGVSEARLIRIVNDSGRIRSRRTRHQCHRAGELRADPGAVHDSLAGRELGVPGSAETQLSC